MSVIYRNGVAYGAPQDWDDIPNKPDTVDGYGITDAYTKTEVDDALDTKVDKVTGKQLSTNDFSDEYKNQLDNLDDALDTKVDKVQGKGLSTNDYDNTEKAEVAKIANKADQATTYTKTETDNLLSPKATTTYVNTELTKKVDKVNGKDLSTEDFTTDEKSKLLGIEPGAQVNPDHYAASLITGVIDISHLPPTVIERQFDVQNDAARFNLTTDDVQNGDTVKVLYSGRMYLVVDDTKLNSEDGYSEYSAGRAGAVDWSGVENKPTTLAGYGITDGYTKTETNNLLNSKADTTTVNYSLGLKVDKITGKGLSTEDYTTAEKNKLAGIAAGAQANTVTGVKGDSESTYRNGNINLTKANIGLGNVNNTSDADKPLSTAAQAALDRKQDTLTFDSTPIENSMNPVTSGGLYLMKSETDKLINALAVGNLYGAIWDRTNAQCTRSRDAKAITTDITHFRYWGSVDANYDNPFDDIYPWSEMKQCNVDLELFRALTSSDSIKDAVIAWEDDPDFVTDGSNGFVGRYCPDFWYATIKDESTGFIEFLVSDVEIPGFLFHKESIRSIGFAVDDGNGGVTATDGQPLTNVSIGSIHTRAKTCGFTLENWWDHFAEAVVLPTVEFATLNAQNAIGDGCSNFYRENAADVPYIAETGATRVVLPNAFSSFAVEGSTLDFGASNGAVVLANRRTCTGYETYGADHISVKFDTPLDITTSMHVSCHGRNNGDSFGSKSGFIGTNTKNNAWYRGAIIHANRFQYLLGLYRASNNVLWYADRDKYNDYDALNTSVHKSTGLTLATSNGYTKELAYLDGIGIILGATAIGGNDQNPVGSFHYINASAGTTIALVGGGAGDGRLCGPCCVLWDSVSSYSRWAGAAFLRLKSENLGF